MITISIDQSKTAFRPGEQIAGIVSWSELDESTTKLETRLIWYTEGKGDQDHDVVAFQSSDSIKPSGSVTFQFTAPTRPYSFSGKLISLIWAIEVVQFPSREGHREQISISRSRQEIILDKSFEDAALKGVVQRIK